MALSEKIRIARFAVISASLHEPSHPPRYVDAYRGYVRKSSSTVRSVAAVLFVALAGCDDTRPDGLIIGEPVVLSITPTSQTVSVGEVGVLVVKFNGRPLIPENQRVSS